MGRPRKRTTPWLDTDPPGTPGAIIYIYWYDPVAGRVRRKSTGSRDEEAARAAFAEHVLTTTRLRSTAPEEAPIGVIVRQYYDDHASRLASAEAANIACARFIGRWGNEPVSALAQRHDGDLLDAYIADRRAEGIADTTISRELSVLRAAVNRAWKRGEITAAPFIRDIEIVRPDPDVLSLKQIASIFDALDPTSHLFDYFMAAGTTLQRTETILDLRMDMCDFDEMVIRTNPPGRTQTKKYRPTIAMPKTFRWHFEDRNPTWIVEYQDAQVLKIAKAVRGLRRRLDLPEWFDAKSLRGSISSYLKISPYNVPEAEIELALGHRRRTTTRMHYVASIPDPDGPVPTAIDAFFRDLQKRVRTPISPEYHPNDSEETGEMADNPLKSGGRGWDRTSDPYDVNVGQNPQDTEIAGNSGTPEEPK